MSISMEVAVCLEIVSTMPTSFSLDGVLMYKAVYEEERFSDLD